MEKVINWAVMGPGRITEEFIPGLLITEGAHPYAVASRSIERAKAAQERWGFDKAYGSYEELIADKNIDVIYISTPTACHFEHAKMCLEAGHNVLCEKSVTQTPEQFEILVETAKKNNVFFMEGVWMQFHPAFRKAVEWATNGTIGKVRFIKAELDYQHPYDGSDRIFSRALGAGNLLDLGVYTFGFASSIFGFNPREIHAAAAFGPDGADLDSNVLLRYEDGGWATLTMGYAFSTAGVCVISGEKGKIEFTERFHDAQKVFLYNENYELVEEFDGTFPATGFEQEVAHVSDCLRKGLKESPVVSFDYTRAIFRIITQCEAQYKAERVRLGLPE